MFVQNRTNVRNVNIMNFTAAIQFCKRFETVQNDVKGGGWKIDAGIARKQ